MSKSEIKSCYINFNMMHFMYSSASQMACFLILVNVFSISVNM